IRAQLFARQGGCHRRAGRQTLGYRGLVQPRSPEPAAGARGQRGGGRRRLCHRPAPAPGVTILAMSSQPAADMTPTPPDDEGTPVSVKIRERLAAARKRFHANDNIAEFIEPGELEKLLDEVEVKMQGVLDSLVINTQGDHNTNNTARRVAKMYLNEVFKGRYVAQPPITEFPNAEHLNELMIVGPLTVRSACSHHFCPVIGKIWIGVMPNEHTNVIGLSKYARLVAWIMGRPQACVFAQADHVGVLVG